MRLSNTPLGPTLVMIIPAQRPRDLTAGIASRSQNAQGQGSTQPGHIGLADPACLFNEYDGHPPEACHLESVREAQCQPSMASATVRRSWNTIDDLKLHPELGKRVELWGFEPHTSCMPSESSWVQTLSDSHVHAHGQMTVK